MERGCWLPCPDTAVSTLLLPAEEEYAGMCVNSVEGEGAQGLTGLMSILCGWVAVGVVRRCPAMPCTPVPTGSLDLVSVGFVSGAEVGGDVRSVKVGVEEMGPLL